MAAAPRLSIFPTELGWMALVESDSGVLRLVIGHENPQAARRACLGADQLKLREPARLSRLAQRLQAYAAGRTVDFSQVPIDWPATTDFRLRVLRETRKIGYGHTLSYLDLAARSGSPRAARAVGNIMATNRIPLLIPCHRVVASGGRLGGFSAPGGVDLKRKLLALEGVTD